MSLSQEIVDSIIARNNVNANEKIYDALFGMASEKIGMRRVELAQNMFASGNYEDDDDYYEQGEDVVEYEDEETEDQVPEEEYEQ
jgi:hypothetical protein